MADHAYLSPSAWERWSNCPAAPALEAKCPPQKTSEYAAEGTAAHTVAEKAITHWLKYRHLVESPADLHVPARNIKVEGYSFEVDSDMLAAAHRMLTICTKSLAECPDALLRVETKVSLSHLVRKCYGTADLVIEQPYDTLRVWDLKYGKGKEVKAAGNGQLRIYALGALWDRKHQCYRPVDSVELGICQPRIGEPLDWEILDSRDLIDWGEEVFKPAAKKALSKKAKPCAGPWCRWCDANGPTCPEATSLRLQTAQQRFGDLDEGRVTAPPQPQELTLPQMKAIYDGRELLKKWLQSVEQHLYHLLNSGKCTSEELGLKLVDGSRTKHWTVEDQEIHEWAKKRCLQSRTAPKTKSPAAMIKEVKEKFTTKEARDAALAALGDLYEIRTGTSMVPIDSPKPEKGRKPSHKLTALD